VEVQEPLVRSARAKAAELGLAGVSFLHADAASVELDGSVFFLYAPFNGAMLTDVLRRLEEVARRRTIVVCTVDLELSVGWLRARTPLRAPVAIYDSSPPLAM
jgi:hypothetical protein